VTDNTPALPATEAGLPTAREVLLAYGNGWHGADCDGNFRMDAACSCALERWLVKAEAEAAQARDGEVARLREALLGVAGNDGDPPCWCDWFDGEHERRCRSARALIEKT
jgi:hypothetical protein